VAVVLHGVGSTADFALRCLAKPLTDLGYDVVAPDLRGHAGSTPLSDPAAHSIEGHVADLSALAARLDVRLVAGISLGGEIALRWIASGADVDGAVVCLPGIAGPTSGPAAANRATAEELARRGVGEVLAAMRDAPDALGWVVDEVRASWPRHDPASLVAALRAVAECEPIDAVDAARVLVPTGVVVVTDDSGHPADVAERLVATLPRSAAVRIRLADLATDRSELGRAGVRALRRAQAEPDPSRADY
ncbi:MAG TPA: alpha/beta fold hydrolase, partial [Mycobacteriales bacterium]|nr:alpha/beta fold hydrolase [Mycobacteriales bacterium]